MHFQFRNFSSNRIHNVLLSEAKYGCNLLHQLFVISLLPRRQPVKINSRLKKETERTSIYLSIYRWRFSFSLRLLHPLTKYLLTEDAEDISPMCSEVGLKPRPRDLGSKLLKHTLMQGNEVKVCISYVSLLYGISNYSWRVFIVKYQITSNK